MTHEIPLRTETFEAINLELQRALFRSDDETVECGDVIKLCEHNDETGKFSGRWMTVRVTHAQRMTVVGRLPRQMVVLSLDVVGKGVEASYFLDTRGAKRRAVAA